MNKLSKFIQNILPHLLPRLNT